MAALSCKFHPTTFPRVKRVPYITCTVQTSQSNIKMIINGAAKEIGRAAVVAVTKARGMEVAGAVDSFLVGEDIGKVCDMEEPLEIPIINDITMVLGSISQSKDTAVVLDFSDASRVYDNVKQATAFGMRSVVYVPRIKMETVAALSAFCEKATMVSKGRRKMSCSCISSLSLNSLIPLTSRAKHSYPSKFTISRPSSPAIIRCSQNEQQLNLSVLRFTLGIPGLDESYLPRYVGYAFGALLALNHFLGSDSSSITPAQLRTEALGLSLASFSAVVPYLGKFLKGATPTAQKSIPEGTEQIFAMSQNISADLKEDLAWATYVLLRNTNSISVLISVEDALCVRGYWNTPKDISKEGIPDWFQKQMQKSGFSKLKDAMYLQQSADLELKEMVPVGTRSLLLQPIQEAHQLSSSQTEKMKGFILLASGIDYAYTDKDKAWIASIANKFGGRVLPS